MPPRRIYYDGDCGLCHAFVRFVLRHDHAARFRFAPLDRWPGPHPRPRETVVVIDPSGGILTRSAAVIYVLEEIGWRTTARLLQAIPAALRDWGYALIARLRRRLFPRPSQVCPVLDPRLRARFDL